MACGLGLVVSMKVYGVESVCRKLLSYYSTPPCGVVACGLYVRSMEGLSRGFSTVHTRFQEGLQSFMIFIESLYKMSTTRVIVLTRATTIPVTVGTLETRGESTRGLE